MYNAVVVLQCLAIWSWQWPNESIVEADPLTSIPEVAKDINHSMVIRHLKQIGKVKKFNNRCLTSWLGKKKIIILKCRLPLLCIKTVNYFAIGQWCVMKSGFYRTTNDDQFSWWTEKTLQSISQSQACTHTHKKSQGHCLVVCWLSDPLQLWESRRKHITFKKHTQHISEIHWEMQHLQLALVNRKGSILLHDNARWHIT